MALRVTIRAIRQASKDIKAAQERLSEAQSEMKSAATALCEVWKGDAATAFAQEQGVVDNWVTKLFNVVSEIIAALTTAAEKYEENEENIMSHLRG